MRQFIGLVLGVSVAIASPSAMRQRPPAGGTRPDAQSAVAPDRAEQGSVEAIARFTTDPRFVSPWVAYVPDVRSPSLHQPVPRPHCRVPPANCRPPRKIYGYFRALAAATPRVRVEMIGRSDEGRDILLVAIADEDGIRDLAAAKAANRRAG